MNSYYISVQYLHQENILHINNCQNCSYRLCWHSNPYTKLTLIHFTDLFGTTIPISKVCHTKRDSPIHQQRLGLTPQLGMSTCQR